jgi:3-oxoacyl-[acyl-carrier-protein] synthase II
MDKKAVITGMGVVSPIGTGKQENWDSLLHGKSGIAKFSRMNPEHLPVNIGAEVKNFDPKQFIQDKKAIRLTYFNVHLALAAAKLAIDDSGLDINKVDPERFGGIIGSGGGGFDDGPGVADLQEPILKSWDEEKKKFDSSKFGEEGLPVAYPLFLLKALPNNAFYYISLLYNIQGENDNIISSYTGGSQAIGDAFRAVRRGLSDVIIAGGYDSLITPNTIVSLDSFNLLSKNPDPLEACRPFDRLRDGMIAGEGAAFLIVEELEHARRRGANIHAEIAGYGNTSNSYNLYNPDPSGNGITRAMIRSIQDAEARPEDIGWVCADGISTKESDKAEAAALKAVFHDRISDVPVSATKSISGHMGAGAGAAEAVYSVMAITNGILPPTLNYNNPDDECNLNLVAGQPLEKKITYAMSINQGIGGQSTALIFKKY